MQRSRDDQLAVNFLILQNGKTLITKKLLIEAFDQYFVSHRATVTITDPPQLKNRNNSALFAAPYDVKTLMQQLANFKPGPDVIHPPAVVICGPVLPKAQPL